MNLLYTFESGLRSALKQQLIIAMAGSDASLGLMEAGEAVASEALKLGTDAPLLCGWAAKAATDRDEVNSCTLAERRSAGASRPVVGQRTFNQGRKMGREGLTRAIAR